MLSFPVPKINCILTLQESKADISSLNQDHPAWMASFKFIITSHLSPYIYILDVEATFMGTHNAHFTSAGIHTGFFKNVVFMIVMTIQYCTIYILSLQTLILLLYICVITAHLCSVITSYFKHSLFHQIFSFIFSTIQLIENIYSSPYIFVSAA